jgi:histidinol-phosphatase
VNLYKITLDFAIETAYLAGKQTLSHFQTGIRADIKTDGSPVTLADRQAEELMRGRIEKAFPGHAIVGEEFGLREAVWQQPPLADRSD